MHLTAADVANEDWSTHDKFSKSPVVCVSDHLFASHAKFSSRLVAVVSREPCPICGNHNLRSLRYGSEPQTIRIKDIGNVENE